MYIAPIIYPGTWLDLPDRDLAFELEGILRHLEDRTAEAALALTMFESSASHLDPNAWESAFQIRQEVDRQLQTECGLETYARDFDKLQLETGVRFLRKCAELGIAPLSYTHKLPFIHAHSFVYAVDSFGKFLEALCDYEVAPDFVKAARDEYNRKLPMVRKIRNSALHLEDRSRGFASARDRRKGKRMSVDGFLGLSNLEGIHLCYTIDDGTYQKIAISHTTLDVLVETLNGVLNAFPWKGLPHVTPGL